MVTKCISDKSFNAITSDEVLVIIHVLEAQAITQSDIRAEHDMAL